MKVEKDTYRKVGMLVVQHLKIYKTYTYVRITMMNICRLSQHLNKQHEISVRSEVRRVLKK